MKVVKFIRNHTPYNAGEIAGFDDRTADELIRAAAAEAYAQAHAPAGPPVNRAVPSPPKRKDGDTDGSRTDQ